MPASLKLLWRSKTKTKLSLATFSTKVLYAILYPWYQLTESTPTKIVGTSKKPVNGIRCLTYLWVNVF